MVVPEPEAPAALRSATVARNLILPFRLRTRRSLRDSFTRTVTTPEAGTVNGSVPRVMRRLALNSSFATDAKPIVPLSPGSALEL